MPLHDHFRPPIDRKHAWESFHRRWIVSLADALNSRLPERFLAENQVRIGQTTEADVVEFDQNQQFDEPLQNGVGHSSSSGGTAVVTEAVTYAPPEVTSTHEYDDAFEVKVYDLKRTRRVVAVIELVSPSNKDRPEEREKFAFKILSYLKAGIGVVVVDIVTEKQFNLHNEVIQAGRSNPKFIKEDLPWADRKLAFCRNNWFGTVTVSGSLS